MNLPKDSERIRFSSTIKKALYKDLQAYSEKTDIPISRLLDRAIEQFFNNKKTSD